MARGLRIHIPGGFYHVTLRGNHRQPIFFNERDRDLLDEIVAEAAEKSGLRIHAFCWMTNHLHLLTQVSDVPLGRAMLRIASRYARSVQHRLETTGHLFERRYHCTIVDADRYLLTLLRYIHLNPVKAGLVRDPTDYRWSSHADYLGLVHRPWVTTRFGLDALGVTRTGAISAYRALMDATGDIEWNAGGLRLNPHYGGVLGDDAFAERVAAGRYRPRSRMTLDELVGECCRKFGMSEAVLGSRTRAAGHAAARAWLAREAAVRRIASNSAVARRLGRSESALRQLLLRYPAAEDRSSSRCS